MYLNRISKNFHLTISIISALLLFFIVTLKAGNTSTIFSVLQDLVAITLLFSLSVQIKEYIRINKISFLSLTFAVAVLLGILLMSIWTAQMFMDNLVQKLNAEFSVFSFASNVVGIIYFCIFCFRINFHFCCTERVLLLEKN